MIKSGLDGEAVAEYMIEQKWDALFTPHCNFGTEDAVAKVGKLVGKPLLLWAPRDPAPGPYGMRATDSQCGVMATARCCASSACPLPI